MMKENMQNQRRNKTVLYGMLKQIFSVITILIFAITGGYLTSRGLWADLYDFAMTPEKIGFMLGAAIFVVISFIKTIADSYDN